MRHIAITTLAVIVCLAATSCVTTQPKETTYHPVHCVVEPETEVIFEIRLDGKLVLSGKAAPKELNSNQFSAPLGDHTLCVTADGHEPWERTISVVGGSAQSQGFWARLKKTE
jgi:hypothetical protein